MRRQRGVVLATTLILTLLVLMLGIAAARVSGHAQKNVRYERDRHIAFAAAEAALADAERDIAGDGGGTAGRHSLFATAPLGLSERCGTGADDLGLCNSKPPAQAPNWQAIDLANDDTQSVSFGTFTGARLSPSAARLPRYLIEYVQPADTSSGVFRVTAVGFGERAGMHVVLQSFYHRPPAVAGMPAGRISWREVPNWRELHRLAVN